MWQIVFTLLVVEWLTTYICKPPKDAPWDILGWQPIIVETQKFRTHQLREINNGRLAMFGILGLIGQDLATGEYATPCLFPTCDPNTSSLEILNMIVQGPQAPWHIGDLYPPAPSN